MSEHRVGHRVWRRRRLVADDIPARHVTCFYDEWQQPLLALWPAILPDCCSNRGMVLDYFNAPRGQTATSSLDGSSRPSRPLGGLGIPLLLTVWHDGLHY